MDFFKRMADYGFFLLISSGMYWLMGKDPTLDGLFGGGLWLVILSAIGAFITYMVRKEN